MQPSSPQSDLIRFRISWRMCGAVMKVILSIRIKNPRKGKETEVKEGRGELIEMIEGIAIAPRAVVG